MTIHHSARLVRDPPVMTRNPPRRSVHVRLPIAQAAWLEAEAAARDVSVARLVELAVEHLPDRLHGGPIVELAK